MSDKSSLPEIETYLADTDLRTSLSKTPEANWPASVVMSTLNSKVRSHDFIKEGPDFYRKVWGFAPIPIKQKEKIPAIKNWQTITADNFEPNRYNMKSGNFGIVCGRGSGIFVVDIDNPKEGEIDSKVWLKAKYEEELAKNPSARHYCNTLMQKTGSGGLHLIYQYEPIFDHFKSNARKFTEDGKVISMDVRSNGGQIVFSPSVHPNGNLYQVICYSTPDTTTAAKHVTLRPQLMPDWLLRLMVGFICTPTVPAPKVIVTKKTITQPKMDDKPVVEKETKLYPYEFLEIRLNLLKLDRFNDYDTWKDLLILMSNLANECEEPDRIRELCTEISQKSEGYDEDSEAIIDCTFRVKKKEKTITIGTLYHWLKEDLSDEEYKKVAPKRDMKEFSFYTGRKAMNYKDWTVKQDKDDIFDFLRQCFHYVTNTRGKSCVVLTDKYRNSYFDQIETRNEILDYQEAFRKLSEVVILNYKETMTKDGEIILKPGSLLDVFNDHLKVAEAYKNLTFCPYNALTKNHHEVRAKVDEDDFNLFAGFPIDYDPNFIVNMEKLALVFKQIKCFSGGNDEMYEYLLNWMAQLVQKPHRKTEVCIVMISEQGTGKSSFFHWLGNCIMGESHYLNISDINSLTGTFNSSSEYKLLTIIEEANVHESDHKILCELKAIITNNTVEIRKKFVQNYTLPNYNNNVICTNIVNCLQLEETDRRFVVTVPSSEFLGDFDGHWTELFKLYNNRENAVHFFHFLMNRNIDKFESRKIPKTEIKEDMKWRKAPAIVKYIHYLFEEGWFNYKKEGNILKCTTEKYCDDVGDWNFSAHVFFDNFRSWVRDNLPRNEMEKINREDKKSITTYLKNKFGVEYNPNIRFDNNRGRYKFDPLIVIGEMKKWSRIPEDFMFEEEDLLEDFQ